MLCYGPANKEAAVDTDVVFLEVPAKAPLDRRLI